MLMIRMLEKGYVAADTHGKVLFEENADHSLFFHFLEADTEPITAHLLKYFNSVIDPRKLDVREAAPNAASLKRVYKALEDLHPFLRNNNDFAIVPEMLAYHLNLCLLQPDFRETVYSQEWYGERLRPLVGDLLKEIYTKPTKGSPYYLPNLDYSYAVFEKAFYDRYLEAREIEKVDQTAILGVKHLTYIQNKMQHHVYWLLDASARHFAGLTLEQRARLYRNLFAFNLGFANLKLVQHTSFSNPHKNKAAYIAERQKQFREILEAVENEALDQYTDELDAQLEKKKYDLETSRILATLRDNSVGLMPDLQRDLQNAIDRAVNESDVALYEEYEVNTLYELLFLEMKQLMNGEDLVKRCRLCSRYFTTTNKNIDYCDHVMEGETQPCSVIGSTRAFMKKLDEDYPLKIYNRAYKTHYARKVNGLMTPEQFEVWRDEAKEKLEVVRSGQLDLVEYESWLKL